LASFRILTFGCKVNQCDSQILRETLASWGLTETGLTEASLAETGAEPEPDLVVINTCTVTSAADTKFRKALRRTRRENPRALIAVTGCHANKTSDSSGQLPGADLVFRTRDFSALADFLRRRDMADAAPVPRVQSYFSEHTRAFLKIQDGCDCFCAYCIVPIVRPRLWSEDPEKVVAAINSLSSKGYREVVLTGIHLGSFGRDSGRTALTRCWSSLRGPKSSATTFTCPSKAGTTRF
jgi:threonylcarbamoyladenosine tRNA methylthiotransferase MtaB